MSDQSAAGLSALMGSMIGLSTISVVLRYCARRRTRAGLEADDWLSVISLLSLVPIAAITYKAIAIKAFGTTVEEGKSKLPELHSLLGVQLQNIFAGLVVFCLACTKASAVFFYRRIFCVVGPGYRAFNLITIITIVSVLCWLLVMELLSGFSCYRSDLAFPGTNYIFKHCRLMVPFFLSMVVSDVILDVWVLALPIPLVFRLQTTLARKMSISGLFLFASIALGASVARMVTFVKIVKPSILMLPSSDDQVLSGWSTMSKKVTYSPTAMMTRCAFYSFLECGVSIIAISLPTIVPLCLNTDFRGFVRFARNVASFGSKDSLLLSFRRSSYYNGSGTQSPARVFSGQSSSRACVTHDPQFPRVDSEVVDKIFVQDYISVSSESV